MDVALEVARAEHRIRRHIGETPLEYSPHLSDMGGCHTYVKLENLQRTGSFKVRGAMNKLLTLSPTQRKLGVVAASSGNHGIAVAFGANALGTRVTVFVPENTSSTKLEAIERFGAEVRRHGTDVAVTEVYARGYAERNGLAYIPPYNDPLVIAGQGTIAVELSRQLERVDAIFVSVGGGGLISGIAGYAKSVFGDVEVLACQPESSPVMTESVKAGEIVEMESMPTLSDGTTGGIESGSITFELCRRFVDRYVLVSESEIAAAMLVFMEAHHMLVEGAAGVAIASYLKTKGQFRNKNVVIVICGANIELQTLKSIL